MYYIFFLGSDSCLEVHKNHGKSFVYGFIKYIFEHIFGTFLRGKYLKWGGVRIGDMGISHNNLNVYGINVIKCRNNREITFYWEFYWQIIFTN